MFHGSVSFFLLFYCCGPLRDLHSFPTRRSSDLPPPCRTGSSDRRKRWLGLLHSARRRGTALRRKAVPRRRRSEEHTSELQSLRHLVCRLLLEKKKKQPLVANGKARSKDHTSFPP